MYMLSNILADKAWSMDNMLSGANTKLQKWASLGVAVLGIIMVIVALFKFGKGMMSDRAQTNWVLVIVLFLVGATLAFGSGWAFVHQMSDFGTNTLNEVNNAGE